MGKKGERKGGTGNKRTGGEVRSEENREWGGKGGGRILERREKWGGRRGGKRTVSEEEN